MRARGIQKCKEICTRKEEKGTAKGAAKSMQDQEEKKADEIDIFINSRVCDCFMCHMCSLGDKRDEGRGSRFRGIYTKSDPQISGRKNASGNGCIR